MKPQSRHDYERGRMADAAKSFAAHVIVAQDVWSWTLRAPTRAGGFGAVTVGALQGHLVVVGDCNTCVFGGGSYSAPRDLVQWIGHHGDLDYVRGKASLGMDDSGGKITEEIDADVAVHDLQELLEQYSEEGEGHEEICTELREAIETAKDATDEEIRELRAELWGTLESETAFSIGEVTAWRVIVAHAVVARLWSLLSAEAK